VAIIVVGAGVITVGAAVIDDVQVATAALYWAVVVGVTHVAASGNFRRR